MSRIARSGVARGGDARAICDYHVHPLRKTRTLTPDAAVAKDGTVRSDLQDISFYALLAFRAFRYGRSAAIAPKNVRTHTTATTPIPSAILNSVPAVLCAYDKPARPAAGPMV